MLSEVQLRFHRKDAWLQETSERHKSISFYIASLYEAGKDVHLSLLVVPADKTTVAALTAEWKREPRIKSILGPYEDPRGARFHFVYELQYSTLPILVKHNLFAFRFVAVTGGSQYLSIIAESQDVKALVEDLNRVGETEILSVRQVAKGASPETPSPIAPMFRNLSETQLRALLLAADRGYYTWPRKVSASDLAKEVGLTVPSFLHHLRLAESALMSASVREFAKVEPARAASLRAESTGTWSSTSGKRAAKAKKAA